jgi:hypothetical protein
VSTTCTDVIARAGSFNALNGALTGDSVEMLSRIRADQQQIFTAIAGKTRDRFKTTSPLNSSVGSSGRTFGLSGVTPPIERILKLTLADGREACQVDELDTDAELPPRYYVRGTTLYEVSNDWSAASGAVTATLLYVYGATAITLAGGLAQVVSIPDEWTDVLVIPLAAYLHTKDPGRDPSEFEKLADMLDEAQQGFVNYLTAYGGITSTRFSIPNPLRTQAKGK